MKNFVFGTVVALVTVAVGMPRVFVNPIVRSSAIVSGIEQRMAQDDSVFKPRQLKGNQIHGSQTNTVLRARDGFDKKQAHSALSMMLMLSMMGGAGNS